MPESLEMAMAQCGRSGLNSAQASGRNGLDPYLTHARQNQASSN